MNPTLTLALPGEDTGEVGDHVRPNEIDIVPACILDVLELLCARGFLRQATRLCLTSKTVAAALPMGTGRQLYDAAMAGNDGQLTVYLEYWRGSRDGSPTVLNWSCKLGESPLVAAARHDRLACVKLLLSFAPIVDVNKGHCTALNWACQSGRDEMVSALLAAPSIDINKASSVSKRTPLHLAAQQGHAGVMRLLVASKGIRLEAKDDLNCTPLTLAEEGKHDEVVAILTEVLEKKWALDTAGSNIYEAACEGDVTALRPLLDEWSGNVDVLDWENDEQFGTAICIASANGHLPAVRLLASTPGVDVNRLSRYGWSALMQACFWAQVDVARFLLTVQGIEINTRAKKDWAKGESALDLAMRTDGYGNNGFQIWELRQEIAAMLRAAGAQEAEEDV